MMTGMVKPLLWLALTLPALLMVADLGRGDVLAMDLLEPSGDIAVRLLVLALMPGPLVGILGPRPLLRAWLAIRRNLGVAAFLYALMHLALYAFDLGSLDAMIDELGLPGIWTGWLALALLVPAAATSTDRAARALGRTWSRVQFVVYPAAIATMVHWLLLEWDWLKAVMHAAPLIIVWILRGLRRLHPLHRRPT
jgi:sulfoxide reductase heme-binding subunit YedZ